jgi:hypothetical protein
MSRAALLLALPIIFACTSKEAPPADTAALAVVPDAAEAVPVNYAGNWTVNVMPADKDTVLLTYDLVTTADRTGWKMTLPGRDVMEPRVVHLDNDSVIVENGPYSSALRKNVMVSTRSVMHMEGDRLVGTTVARYDTKGADSVVNLRTIGTRK